MNVAFIPVRGGSKSIPLKNIKEICGKPLVYWTVRAACRCDHIQKVYVATDSEIIRKTVESFSEDNDECFSKISVIERSKENASDTASTESAMLEFAEKVEFDNIVLIQATSPLLTENDLYRGFELFETEGTGSVLSGVRQKRFIWLESTDGFAKAVNYDYTARPRRQEFDGYIVENGAFYITTRKNLIKDKNRISGNIKICEMDESTYYEIDEPSDWVIIEKLLYDRENKKSSSKPNLPKLFLMDCDGVLTDGGMYYSEKGDELKKFNTLDGMGIRILREHGIKVGVITGENMALNRCRAEKLQLDYCEQGVSDKLATVKKICESEHVDLSDVMYIGDDINDLELIKQVGIGCSVANGMSAVKAASAYVSTAKGGSGAVREIVNWIIGE